MTRANSDIRRRRGSCAPVASSPGRVGRRQILRKPRWPRRDGSANPTRREKIPERANAAPSGQTSASQTALCFSEDLVLENLFQLLFVILLARSGRKHYRVLKLKGWLVLMTFDIVLYQTRSDIQLVVTDYINVTRAKR